MSESEGVCLVLFCFLLLVASFRFAWTQDAAAEQAAEVKAEQAEVKAEQAAEVKTKAEQAAEVKATYESLNGSSQKTKQQFRGDWAWVQQHLFGKFKPGPRCDHPGS